MTGIPCGRPPGSRHFLLLGCEVLHREICYLSAFSPHRIDLQWLPQGLHDLGAEGMRSRLQAAIDVEYAQRYDAILLGYGLCNNGVAGLTARTVPLVIPRVHDCISLFLGSHQRYAERFQAHPDTYYLTTGWMERDEEELEDADRVQDRLGLGMSMEALIEAYGEENAAFLAETLGDLTQNYSRLAYIEFAAYEHDLGFRAMARQLAEERGWTFQTLAGDLGLLNRLLRGEWGQDVLVVPPGSSIAPSHDEAILCTRCPDTRPESGRS